jgi:hypothetical protein
MYFHLKQKNNSNFWTKCNSKQVENYNGRKFRHTKQSKRRKGF